MNLEKIPDNEQSNILQSYWTMLKECELKVIQSKDHDGCINEPLLKHWVEGWFQEWNRVTGQDLKPSWEIE